MAEPGFDSDGAHEPDHRSNVLFQMIRWTNAIQIQARRLIDHEAAWRRFETGVSGEDEEIFNPVVDAVRIDGSSDLSGEWGP